MNYFLTIRAGQASAILPKTTHVSARLPRSGFACARNDGGGRVCVMGSYLLTHSENVSTDTTP